MGRSATWLSITPEPERELPVAVATLRRGETPAPEAVAAEAERVEQLILYGSEQAWLEYLHGVIELIDGRTLHADAEVQHARARATAVLANHHNLLLGLHGGGAELTASDLAHLMRLASETTH